MIFSRRGVGGIIDLLRAKCTDLLAPPPFGILNKEFGYFDVQPMDKRAGGKIGGREF